MEQADLRLGDLEFFGILLPGMFKKKLASFFSAC
jgi:hypothetical protein